MNEKDFLGRNIVNTTTESYFKNSRVFCNLFLSQESICHPSCLCPSIPGLSTGTTFKVLAKTDQNARNR